MEDKPVLALEAVEAAVVRVCEAVTGCTRLEAILALEAVLASLKAELGDGELALVRRVLEAERGETPLAQETGDVLDALDHASASGAEA